MSLQDQIQSILSVGNSNTNPKKYPHLTQLTGDCSGKKIWRVTLDTPIEISNTKENSLILMEFPEDLPQSHEHWATSLLSKNTRQYDLFVEISLFLKENHTRTPQVIHHQTKPNFVIQQDLGSTTLFDQIDGTRKCNDPVSLILIGRSYEEILSWIFNLQQLTKKIPHNHITKQRTLDISTFRLEFNEFWNNLPPSCNQLELDYEVMKTWYETDILEKIEEQPKRLTHRDLQSRNIMIHPENEPSPWVIDVQDMCLGPELYDLASLLYDPNAMLSSIERIRLAKLYWKRYCQTKYPLYPEYLNQLRITAVCRVIHALGRHGNIYQRTGRQQSLDMIFNASSMLIQIMNHIERETPIEFSNHLMPILEHFIQFYENFSENNEK